MTTRNSGDILRLRILLCMVQDSGLAGTVTALARVLREEKYTISRAMSGLEKAGLVDRKDPRRPVLTKEGEEVARRYAERVEQAQNHLLYEGLDVVNAQEDAYHWALYNTEPTMKVIKETNNLYCAKYELRGWKRFLGAELVRHFRNGIYHFPFLIYREKVKNGNILSVANDGLENPCTVTIDRGVGTIQLHAISMMAAGGAGRPCFVDTRRGGVPRGRQGADS